MRQLLVATSDQPRVRRLELRVRPVSATRNAEENDGVDAAGARLTEAPLPDAGRPSARLEAVPGISFPLLMAFMPPATL